MACGGSCTCETRRDPITLTEAVAQAIVDMRAVRYAVNIARSNSHLGVEDIVAMVNDAKIAGNL